jgi:hypothetical protein
LVIPESEGGFTATGLQCYPPGKSLVSRPWFLALPAVKRYLLYRNKAVADGAISFYIDHYVHTRVSKFDYGQFSNVRYNPQNPEHVARYRDSYVSLSGERNIKNSFSVILPKVDPGMIYFAFFILILGVRIHRCQKQRNSLGSSIFLERRKVHLDPLRPFFGLTVVK